MNFIPKDLKVFLEDYKKIHRKILNSALGITDLNFNGDAGSTFELDFTKININEPFSFLLVISDLFINFADEAGKFSITLITKSENQQTIEHGKIYTGLYNNKQFRNNQHITTSLILNKPTLIILKINSSKVVDSVFNVGITINQ